MQATLDVHDTNDAQASECIGIANDSVSVQSNDYKLLRDKTVYTTAECANDALKCIGKGTFIGIDMEYGKRKPPAMEPTGSSNERRLHQVVELYKAGPQGIKLAWNDIAIPVELVRILEEPTIIKCGVGIINDAKVLWEDFRCHCYTMLDLGLLVRICSPEDFAESTSNVSLRDCVQHVLQRNVLKEERKDYNWKEGLPADSNTPLYHSMVQYAAIDAEASYELYGPLVAMLYQKEEQLGREIPYDWFTFNYVDGRAYVPGMREEDLAITGRSN
ncbi:hypothetical protein R3P38DRAFT_3219142 [Favolaschia claudopus]|uniref:3'-5' exonuclease domain-containing protein n=1 Tax=Favolaschia claudopus TaxID=2862362 RepID=A0AAW0A2B3_9AGAR